jgi:hypothetical protein
MGRPVQGPPPIFAARARRLAIDPTSELQETDMGRCILALSEGDKRQSLQGVWYAVSAAHRNFRMRIIGQTGDPKNAATPMMTDAMETDPGLRVDLRTAEERDAAARRAWAEWEAKIAALPVPMHKWALRAALKGFMGDDALWRDGKPTPAGVAAVHALSLLTDR